MCKTFTPTQVAASKCRSRRRRFRSTSTPRRSTARRSWPKLAWPVRRRPRSPHRRPSRPSTAPPASARPEAHTRLPGTPRSQRPRPFRRQSLSARRSIRHWAQRQRRSLRMYPDGHVVADRNLGTGRELPGFDAHRAEAENEVLAFMDFPRAHRKQIASTNPLELRSDADHRQQGRDLDASIDRFVSGFRIELYDYGHCTTESRRRKRARAPYEWRFSVGIEKGGAIRRNW